MCGITGFLASSSSSTPQDLKPSLERALTTLQKRGPDHTQTYFSEALGFGHARLSIIDLAASANQPMQSPCGRYSLIFNGEILNYLELKKPLLDAGVIFQTQSDSEVLLYLLMREGEGALPRLRGFFAFAFYDHREEALLLARDSVGIKPLYYCIEKNQLFFASELKALLQYPIRKDLDPDSVHAYFQLTYIPGPFSILKNIYQVKPGHSLLWQKRHKIEKQFFFLKSHPQILDYQEAQQVLKTKMDVACKRWLISDAPLGAFLSGGVDSSIVVALAAHHHARLKTFSIGFEQSSFHDETMFSDLVAKKYDTDHHKIILSENDLESATLGALDYLDEPFADTSSIPTFALCQALSKNLKVSLSGDGADELFGGYEKYRGEWIAQNLWARNALLPFSKTASAVLGLIPQSRDGGWRHTFYKANRLFMGLSTQKKYRYWAWCKFNSEKTLRPLFHRDFLNRYPFQPLEHYDSTIFPPSPFLNSADLNEFLYRDLHNVLPNDMLTKVDRMSMANSLEVRPIFLDQDVIDFAFQIPESFKIDADSKKKILVDTFKSLLPPEVHQRPKHGFSVDLEAILKKQFHSHYRESLFRKEDVERFGILDYQNTLAFMTGEKSSIRQKDYQPLAWSLIVFQSFLKKYL